MNIFLIHTFYRWIWTKKIVYSFQYPILIFLVLMGMSVATSIIIEEMKKVICFRKVIKRAENYLLGDK